MYQNFAAPGGAPFFASFICFSCFERRNLSGFDSRDDVMPQTMRQNRVPEHLMGTRQGLFFLLTSGVCPPVEDHCATQDLPRARPARPAAPAQRTAQAPQLEPAPPPERGSSILNEVLSSDDFHFNL